MTKVPSRHESVGARIVLEWPHHHRKGILELTPTRMKELLTASLLMLVLAACQPEAVVNSPFHGNPYSTRKPAPDFTLTDTQGRLFRLSAERGTPVLLFFGYTHCPNSCPSILYNVGWIFDQLASRPEYRIRFIMVSIDPQRDTPAVLASYLHAYHSDFIGLTGDASSIQKILSAYGISTEIKQGSGGDYTISYSPDIFAIDRQGNLVTRYPYGTEPESILNDMYYLIQEH